MEFVNSILDSIGAIAQGPIGIVAEKVEGALAKALPLAISFLASLLGLGGISEKIREGIEAVRKPIAKAVDFVVMGAVKGFKKLFGGAIGWVKGKAAKGKAWAVGKAKGLKQRLTGRGEEPTAAEQSPDEARSQAAKAQARDRFVAEASQLDDIDAAKAKASELERELKPIGVSSMELVEREEGRHELDDRGQRKGGQSRGCRPGRGCSPT